MDAFEDLIATLLEKDGFWVQTTFKVELTKEEKKEIGRPSSPRWKLDLIAYKASTNDILAVECKSYLDSYGVRLSGFDGSSRSKAIAISYSTSLNCVRLSSIAWLASLRYWVHVLQSRR